MQRIRQNVFLGDALQYFISKAVPGISFALFVVLAVKIVGSEAYGIYSTVYTSAVFLAVLSVSWFNQAQLRYASSVEHIIAVHMRRRVVLIAFCLIILVVFLWFVLSTSWAAIPSIPFVETALVALVYVLYLLRKTGLQAALRAADFRRMEILRAITLIMAVVVIAITGFRYWLALVAAVLLSLSVPLLAIRKPALFRSEPAEAAGESQPHITLKDCFTYGWPVAFWLALMALLPAFERWLIVASYGDVELGNYSGLYDILTRGLGLLLFPLTMALHPRYMAAVNSKQFKEAEKYLHLSYRWSLAIAGLAVIGWVAGVERLLYLILPELEAGTAGYVWYMVISAILWQFALIIHKPLEAQRQTRVMLFFMFVCMSFIIVFDLSMIDVLGLAALPIASSIGALLYILMCSGSQLGRFRLIV